MKLAAALLVLVVAASSGCVQTGMLIEEPDLEEVHGDLPPLEGGEDPCNGIKCAPSVRTCPGGFDASCRNVCYQGECSSCEPSCTCLEEWFCSPWGPCMEGISVRECSDKNSCGTLTVKPPESLPCSIPSSAEVVIASLDPFEEFVEIANLGNAPAGLLGWTLSDEKGHEFFFPEYELFPGASVRLRKGALESTKEDLYWGNNANVWNDDGDTAFLYDREGALVDEYSY